MDASRIWGFWVLTPGQVSQLSNIPSGYQATSTSNTSGPASDVLGVSAATSAFIGDAHIVFLNYPWVDGIAAPLGAATT